MKDRILYALPLQAPHGDLDRKKSSTPDDIEVSELLNDGLSDSVSFYYEKVRGDTN